MSKDGENLKMRSKKLLPGSGLTMLNHLFLLIYVALSIYPIIWMMFYSFKNNEEIFVTNPFGFPRVFRIENYIRAWTEYDIVTYFRNSLVVGFGTVLLTIIAALMFAYATARFDWKLADFTRIFVISGLFIPVQIVLVPLLILIRDLKLGNSLFSLIIPYAAFQLPMATMIFHSFLRGIPFELEEAANIDGAGTFRTFVEIIVPIVKPAIATVSIFVFLSSWNEFTMALILISEDRLKTLPLGLLNFQGAFNTDWGAMGAALMISSLPTILFYLFFSNQVEKAMGVSGAVK